MAVAPSRPTKTRTRPTKLANLSPSKLEPGRPLNLSCPLREIAAGSTAWSGCSEKRRKKFGCTVHLWGGKLIENVRCWIDFWLSSQIKDLEPKIVAGTRNHLFACHSKGNARIDFMTTHRSLTGSAHIPTERQAKRSSGTWLANHRWTWLQVIQQRFEGLSQVTMIRPLAHFC